MKTRARHIVMKVAVKHLYFLLCKQPKHGKKLSDVTGIKQASLTELLQSCHSAHHLIWTNMITVVQPHAKVIFIMGSFLQFLAWLVCLVHCNEAFSLPLFWNLNCQSTKGCLCHCSWHFFCCLFCRIFKKIALIGRLLRFWRTCRWWWWRKERNRGCFWCTSSK